MKSSKMLNTNTFVVLYSCKQLKGDNKMSMKWAYERAIKQNGRGIINGIYI